VESAPSNKLAKAKEVLETEFPEVPLRLSVLREKPSWFVCENVSISVWQVRTL